MAWVDKQGKLHFCSFDIDLQLRQKARKEWRESKTLSNFIALVKSEREHRRKHGGGLIEKALVRWRIWRYYRWLKKNPQRTERGVSLKD